MWMRLEPLCSAITLVTRSGNCPFVGRKRDRAHCNSVACTNGRARLALVVACDAVRTVANVPAGLVGRSLSLVNVNVRERESPPSRAVEGRRNWRNWRATIHRVNKPVTFTQRYTSSASLSPTSTTHTHRCTHAQMQARTDAPHKLSFRILLSSTPICFPMTHDMQREQTAKK